MSVKLAARKIADEPREPIKRQKLSDSKNENLREIKDAIRDIVVQRKSQLRYSKSKAKQTSTDKDKTDPIAHISSAEVECWLYENVGSNRFPRDVIYAVLDLDAVLQDELKNVKSDHEDDKCDQPNEQDQDELDESYFVDESTDIVFEDLGRHLNDEKNDGKCDRTGKKERDESNKRMKSEEDERKEENVIEEELDEELKEEELDEEQIERNRKARAIKALKDDLDSINRVLDCMVSLEDELIREVSSYQEMVDKIINEIDTETKNRNAVIDKLKGKLIVLRQLIKRKDDEINIQEQYKNDYIKSKHRSLETLRELSLDDVKRYLAVRRFR